MTAVDAALAGSTSAGAVGAAGAGTTGGSAAGAGTAATAGAVAGAGAGLSTAATVAIVAGVSVAAGVTGLAVTGTFSGSSSASRQCWESAGISELYRTVPVILTALIYFGILTLWIPDYWPITVFQVGVFTLAPIVVWRSRDRLPGLTYPLIPLGFAVVLGLVQWLAGWTAYPFATQTATVHWATFLAVFIIGICLLGDEKVSCRFRAAVRSGSVSS